MTRKTVTLDFGHLFINGRTDAAALVHEVEKFINVNMGAVLEGGAYRAKQFHDAVPMKLSITITLEGDAATV